MIIITIVYSRKKLQMVLFSAISILNIHTAFVLSSFLHHQFIVSNLIYIFVELKKNYMRLILLQAVFSLVLSCNHSFFIPAMIILMTSFEGLVTNWREENMDR